MGAWRIDAEQKNHVTENHCYDRPRILTTMPLPGQKCRTMVVQGTTSSTKGKCAGVVHNDNPHFAVPIPPQHNSTCNHTKPALTSIENHGSLLATQLLVLEHRFRRALFTIHHRLVVGDDIRDATRVFGRARRPGPGRQRSIIRPLRHLMNQNTHPFQCVSPS